MDTNKHILIVDDNASIHQDIESVLVGALSTSADEEFLEMEEELFANEDEEPSSVSVTDIHYDIDHAYQGEEAVKLTNDASEKETPYSLIFMDVRMPPGMDGIQTIKKIWENHPYTQIVICTAYSDYSWESILSELGTSDRLLFMRKPFDATALKQTTLTLTTKWKLEKEALKYTEKLEQEVEERTKELSQMVEDYKQMKEKAEKASEAKSEFLANVSHEIRTPMNGIIGMNDLLMDTDLDDEQKEYAGMVKFSANALMRIINDILDLSKVEAGKMDIEIIPFNLRESLAELERLIRFSVQDQESDVDVSLEIDEDTPEQVMGDPMRIRQILLNYGNNAVKFTEEGEIGLKAKLVDQTYDAATVKFSVTDTGIGIAEDKVEQIFSPFTQAEVSTTREYGGTGLGLSICKKLAELMDGEVGVESTINEGSEFWFKVSLPLVTDQENDGKIVHEPESFSKETANGTEKLKVLLAEDNKSNQRHIKQILEQSGLTIETVQNGKEVVDAFGENKYDIVIMDLFMPEVDGIDAIKAIRNVEDGGNKVPIIAISASALPEDQKGIYAAGVNDFLEKPISKSKLLSKVKEWTSGSVKIE
ncbi:MAG: response regulator [Balneolaceae bacterium]|nr:response regulator [Balneolaceae bacterium]